MRAPRLERLLVSLAASLAAVAVAAQAREVVALRGTVRGGAADERAAVEVWRGDKEQKRFTHVADAQTRADGGFVVEDVPWFSRDEIGTQQLVLVARSRRFVGLHVLSGPAAARDGVVVELRPQRTLRGRVTDLDTGTPVACAQVWPEVFGRRLGSAWLAGPLPTWRAETDQDGRFRIRGLPAGVAIKALARGHDHATTWVDLPVRRAHLNIALPAAGRVVGRVLDPRGQPAPGVRVIANGKAATGPGYEFATSDAHGRFELRSLAEGEYSVVASTARLQSVPLPMLDVRPGRSIRCDDLRLAAPARVVGRVVDAASGAPIDPGLGALVRLDGG